MLLRLICRGVWRLYAVCSARGECELLDFLDADKSDRFRDDKNRMLAHLDRVAHTFERPRQAEISHLVDRELGIWQFTRGRIRVLWFYDEGRLMLFSHGFVKKTRTTPPGELDKARRKIKAYFQAKTDGTRRFVED